MKLFDKATLKLTAIYTAIIMVISIAFSGVIGMITVGEVRRPFKVPSALIEVRASEDFINAYANRADRVERKVWASLALVNVNMLIVGAILSYALARWTLKPIERTMQDETRFVSDASHELRTPLATMRMENEITLRDKNATKEDYRQQVQSNLEEIDKLHRLVDTLLKLSGSSRLDGELVDAHDATQLALDRIARLADIKKISIDNQVEHFVLDANEDALVEIIYIYLENAIKYAPESSAVEIFSSDRKSVSVRDHGPGIDSKDLPNIFNRFYQADTSRNTEGFGLGLSLASHLAERMGGRVLAINNKGKQAPGATFTVRLK